MGARFTDAHLAAYRRDGFTIVPRLLDAECTDLLRRIAKAGRAIQRDRSGRADGEGGTVV